MIGAGNLATHLAVALQNNGYEILQVYSKTEQSAKQLASKLEIIYTTSVEKILPGADIYFVALKDSVITEVLSGIGFNTSFLVHCSGSMPMSVLDGFSANVGVFYPLQTFSKDRPVDFSQIPVFIEANSEENESILFEVASKLSTNVRPITSEKRKDLHLAAVIANNFSNHLFTLAAEFVEQKGIPFDVLHPLILETALKVQKMEPRKAQTGPAVRFDQNIINRHLNELNEFPELKELYESISKSIFEFHQKNI